MTFCMDSTKIHETFSKFYYAWYIQLFLLLQKKNIQLFLLLLVNVLDSKWIQVIFETPELKVGSLWFQYGGEREVKLEITYVTRRSDKGKG